MQHQNRKPVKIILRTALPLLLIAICIFMVCSCRKSKTSWSRQYRKFIRTEAYLQYDGYDGEYYIVADAAEDQEKNPISFALKDISDDGIPELILFNGAGSPAEICYIFTYGPDGVRCAGSIYSGSLYYSDYEGIPGLHWFEGRMGYYTGYYAFLENGTVKTEKVFSQTEIIKGDELAGYYVLRSTDHMRLFNAFAFDYPNPLRMYSSAEIRSMGWDAFIRAYQ